MKQLKVTLKPFLDKDGKQIVAYFFLWKIGLIFISILAPIISLRGRDFLGGGIQKYSLAPWFYGWANFDGEHYLSIASNGYKSLELAFFPVYPNLIRLVTAPLNHSTEFLILAGLLISNISFLMALIILFKLVALDFSKQVARISVLALLLFPTSFYFGALYNESLYLLLTVGSFYLIRKSNWFSASLLGAVSSATRVFGFLLAPAFWLEVRQNKMKSPKLVWIFAIPFGLLIYMTYLWINTGDPVAFYSLQKNVGPQHGSGITLIPQIYFRYVKILLTTPFNNPIYQTVVLELFTGVVFFILPVYGFFKKMRYSYLFYGLAGFLLPTIQGSFSSLPRYVIILFPSFILIAIFLTGVRKPLRVIVLTFSGLLLIIESMLFLRGYWVA